MLKVKVQAGRTRREYRYSSTLSLTLALDGGGWSAPCPVCSTTTEDAVPVVEKARWAPGQI
jgi:hypothetical protein